MALPKLTTDLNVIQGLPDTPSGVVGGLTAQQVKVKFDTAGLAIQNYLNTTSTGLVDSVQTALDGKISKSGDTMTGTLNLPTGGLTVGTSQLYVSASGQVGVNTTSPGHKLDVNGTARLGANNNTDSDANVLIDGGQLTIAGSTTQAYKSQFELNSSSLTLRSNGYYSGGDQLYDSGKAPAAISLNAGNLNSYITLSTKDTNTAGATERVRVDKSGNVGIGTAAPAAKLEVNGVTRITRDSSPTQYIEINNGISGNVITSVSPAGNPKSLGLISDLGNITLSTNASERMRIDSSGNVGVGTTAPGYKLDVNGTGNFTGDLTAPTQSVDNNSTKVATTAFVLGQTSTATPNTVGSTTGSAGASTRYARADHTHQLGVSGVTAGTYPKVTVDVYGRVTGGTTLSSTDIPSGLDTSLLTTGTLSTARGGTGLSTFNTNGAVYATSTSALTTGTLPTNAGGTGLVGFSANAAIYSTSNTALTSGTLPVVAGGTGTTSSTGTGSVVLGTSPSIATPNFTGNVYLATGTASTLPGLTVTGSAFTPASSGRTQLLMSTSSASSINMVSFYNTTSTGTNVGNISVTTTATAYGTTSDYRLKNDFQDFKGSEIVDKIKVYDYEWKADKTRSYGVKAHELQEVLPYAVVGEKDAVDEEGNIAPQNVDYSKLVPILIKTIQEQQERITALETKIGV